MKKNILHLLVLFCWVLISCSDSEPNLDLRHRVRRLILDNGMHVLLLPRPDSAAVFAANIKVKVGSIEDPVDDTGLAHFFEHMAFKGTDKIGTKDFAAEEALLAKQLEVGTALMRAEKTQHDETILQPLRNEFERLTQALQSLADKNEFMTLYQKNGGRDINASTSNDFTTYTVSLPTSKLEMWAYMESQRFTKRPLREFFSEKGVVAEERKLRNDNSPAALLFEKYMSTAFVKSPYRTLPIGTAKDISEYIPEKALEFYKKNYTADRMFVSLVGNFDVDEAEAIIRKYFSSLPKGDAAPEDFAKEDVPSKEFPKKDVMTADVEPRFFLGYHRPGYPNRDDTLLDITQSVLCDGRTSRLYKRIVIQDKIAAYAVCYASLPGVRLDSVFTFAAQPLAGHTNDEVIAVIREEIARLQKEGPTAHELQIVKNRNEASFIYGLEENAGLANALAFYEALTGDWQYLYANRETIQKADTKDIQRVAKEYFVPEREVLVKLERP